MKKKEKVKKKRNNNKKKPLFVITLSIRMAELRLQIKDTIFYFALINETKFIRRSLSFSDKLRRKY